MSVVKLTIRQAVGLQAILRQRAEHDRRTHRNHVVLKDTPREQTLPLQPDEMDELADYIERMDR